MTILEAIIALEKLAERFSPNGGAIQVYFDCPKCRQPFRPDFVSPKYESRVVIAGKDQDQY